MTNAVFWFCIGALSYLNALLVVSILLPRIRLWPPPDTNSRFGFVARVTRLLAPLTVCLAFALGLLDWNGSVLLERGRFVVGPILFLAGGGFALWGYFGLGIRASQGHHEGLVAAGAYRYSRNPQYVGTIVCLLGYAVLCGSGLTLAVSGLWSCWFVLAPFAEEPWLREQIGSPYDEYAQRVPRFLGLARAVSERAA